MNRSKSAFHFGAWGWFLIVLCIFYQMMYSAYAVDGINGYGISLAARFSHLSGKAVSPDMLTAVLTPIGILCCLLGIGFTNLVYKKGAKPVAVIACIGMALSVFFFAHIRSFSNYIVGLFFVQAFGSCLAFAAHHGFIGAWFPKRKGVVMGYTTMGLPLSSMLVIPFVTWCMGSSFGWEGFCYTMAAVLLALSAATFFFSTNTPEEKGLYPDNIRPEEEKKTGGIDLLRYFKSKYRITDLLKNKSVWLICIGFGIPWATTAGVMSQLIPRMMSTGHFSSIIGPVAIMSGSTVVGLIGSFCWGYLDTKIGTKIAGVYYNLAYVLILIVLIFLHRLPVIACTIITSIVCFTAGGIANLMPSMVISKFGRYEFLSANRVCTPIAAIIHSFGFAILSLGKMMTGGSWIGGYGVFILFCLAGALILYKMDDSAESDDKETEKELYRLAGLDGEGK